MRVNKTWALVGVLILDNLILGAVFWKWDVSSEVVPRPQKIYINFQKKPPPQVRHSRSRAKPSRAAKKRVVQKKTPTSQTKRPPVSKTQKKSPVSVGDHSKVAKKKPSRRVSKALSNFLNGVSEAKKTNKTARSASSGMVRQRHQSVFKNSYSLKDRKAIAKPRPVYDCNEEGVVVVRVVVNSLGLVSRAIPGVKGSTTSDPCLLNRAKQAALKTKWSADEKAPENQVGKIIYRFLLGQ